MDELNRRLDRIDNKLDNIDNKLDSQLNRLSRAEEAIVWMKGHIKIVTTIGTTIVISLVGLVFKFIIK